MQRSVDCLNRTMAELMLLRLTFLIQTELKRNVLSPLLLNFSLEFTIRDFQENQEGFKLNETHQLLIHAGDINVKGEDIKVIKTNTEALLVASKEFCLESDSKKTNYIFAIRQQNARRWLTKSLEVTYGLNSWERQ